MQIHDLKIDPQPFADLVSGAKTCEIRNDDRGFEVDDMVRFTGGYTRTISHIQRGYGLPDGLCVLSYAQASTAPEQEAVAWRGFNVLGECVTGWVDGAPPAHMVDLCNHPARFARIERAYTDPSAEIERLRAQLTTERLRSDAAVGDANEAERKVAYLQKTVDGMNEAHAEVVQRMAEAQALLKRATSFVAFVHKCCRKNGEYAPLHYQEMFELDRDLSATAQPAECETCNGSQVVATTDKDHEGNTIECRCPICAQPAEVKS